MQVTIDDNAGFCFGVVNAIGIAERELAEHAPLYCLGDIVHNNAEVRRLNQKGLQVITHAQLSQLATTSKRPVRVLIRAHGEPPSTYRQAAQLGIRVIDATCPIVLALQQRIRNGYLEMSRRNPVGQVVIFGKPGHAEVIGLCGQTDNHAIVVSRPDDLDALDFARPMRLYAQTTQSKEQYALLQQNIMHRIAKLPHPLPDDHFVAYNTICNRVANRAQQLEQFARQVDMVLFVSGMGSSNGHYLYEYCLRVQPNTRLLSDPEGLNPDWFRNVESVGITGATSTPRWLMEEIAAKITSDEK